MKTKKKRSSQKIEVFFRRNQVKTKKKGLHRNLGLCIFGRNLRFIRAGWLLIVSSSSAQILMGGRLNLDGGTLNLDGGTRPPYNLSTGNN